MGRAHTCNPTAGFSTDTVAAGLCRLYTIDGGQLVPELDANRMPLACPITLVPIEDPVLLEDGVVYEQAAIAQWLERNSNAPCTNMQVQKFRLLKLEPFRDVINKFSKSKQALVENSWRAQLLKVEELATCSSSPLSVRCARVEQAIASCVAEALDLETGLQVAHCTADRLRAELRYRQEKGTVRLQRAARCWLARRRLRALRLLRSAMQCCIARRFLERSIKMRVHAAVRIQQWWKKQQKKMVSLVVGNLGKLAKRKRHGRRKKARGKALHQKPSVDRPNTARQYTMFYFWDPDSGEFSVSLPSESSSGVRDIFEKNSPPGVLKFRYDFLDIDVAYDTGTGEVAWAMSGESVLPAVVEDLEAKWIRRLDKHGRPYYFNQYTDDVWAPGEPRYDNPLMLSLVEEITLFLTMQAHG